MEECCCKRERHRLSRRCKVETFEDSTPVLFSSMLVILPDA